MKGKKTSGVGAGGSGDYEVTADEEGFVGEELGAVGGKNIAEICELSISDCNTFLEEIELNAREGKIADVEVKKSLASAINQFLDPIREKRKVIAQETL